MKARLYPGQRFLGGILAGAVLASLALQPVATRAAILGPVSASGGITMHETFQVLQSGLRVPGSGLTTSVLTRGAKDTLAAPRIIPGTTPGTSYLFLFWDIDGQLVTHAMTTFTASKYQANFAATAWYVLAGGGGSGASAVAAYGFSLLDDKLLAGTPIASAAPSSAWTAPSTSVSTATPVTITAANPVTFVQWLAPGAVANDTQLSVGAGISTLAIAFYGRNPCQYIQNEIAGLSAADFPPPNPVREEQALARALELQFKACEARHSA